MTAVQNRLDRELARRGLTPTRTRARAAILAGQVTVDGAPATRPSLAVGASARISISGEAARYVGRGAVKIVAGIEAFGIGVQDRVAVDVGASTGGFTDALLQRGAKHVTAVDVGHRQLHHRLAADRRVHSIEGCNIRYADVTELGAPFDLIVCDLSFISLTLVAAKLRDLGHEEADWLLLVKPQFELGRRVRNRAGVVRSPTVRAEALQRVADHLDVVGLGARGAIRSPVPGSSGNLEALLWLRPGERQVDDESLRRVFTND